MWFHFTEPQRHLPCFSLSCFRKKRLWRKLGSCCIHGTFSPWCFLGKWNTCFLRTGFGANAIQVVQCTATVFVVWPSLNLHVMQWNTSLKDTPKHHLTCPSGHSVGDFANLSQTCIYIYILYVQYSVWDWMKKSRVGK